MEKNLMELDIITLKTMYHEEDVMFKQALLEGKSWDELADQRHKVTQLAIHIHKKLHPMKDFNPAEFIKRENYTDSVP